MPKTKSVILFDKDGFAREVRRLEQEGFEVVPGSYSFRFENVSAGQSNSRESNGRGIFACVMKKED
jgi:hypothetical protein